MESNTKSILRAIRTVVVFEIAILLIGYLFFGFVNYSPHISEWSSLSRFALLLFVGFANLYPIGLVKKAYDKEKNNQEFKKKVNELIKRHTREN